MMELPDVIKRILILIFVFVPIEKAFAVHHQKLLREGWFTDLFYYFSGYFIGHGTFMQFFRVRSPFLFMPIFESNFRF